MFTEKLYYEDSYIKEFTAEVISCELNGKEYDVILNKTSFFPEGGGQKYDTGFIGDEFVSAVYELQETIVHKTKNPLEVNKSYNCKINWETRFSRMQNHSGEHIVSGIVNKKFGYENVGFHMEEEYVTIDFNGELTRKQLEDIEIAANEAVCKNLEFKTYFPDAEQLKTLFYRSKLDLTENVRIVEIENTDVCACCAPHVKLSGEIGLIKLLDFMKHRGGVRIIMKAGKNALLDYHEKYKSVLGISNLLSVKQENVLSATEKVYEDLQNERRKYYEYKISNAVKETETAISLNGSLVLFTEQFDNDMMREAVNALLTKTDKYACVFSGDNEKGYSFVVASKNKDMKSFSKELNTALNGRGGGKDNMIQGKVTAEKSAIEKFLQECK